MSTFLTICQRVRQECGIAGTGPATVVGQTGILGKIVDRTAHAWVDIQASRPTWKFLRNQTTQSLVIAKRTYNVSSDWSLTSIDKFDMKNAYIYKTSTSDESPLTWWDYQTFRQKYRVYSTGRPTIITPALAGNVAFNIIPDYAYTVTFDYWMTPELLAIDADIPACPEQYQDAILWKSVMMFAGNETASELYNYAKSMYSPVRLALDVDQGEVPIAVRNSPLAMGMRDSGTTMIRLPGQ